MSLSDLFCVERHKEYFLDLVQNKLILLCQWTRNYALIGAKNFQDAVTFVKNKESSNYTWRSRSGGNSKWSGFECFAKFESCWSYGAGDLFAAGFLHGYINKLSIKESLDKGTELSSKIIQQVGARL